MTIDLATWQQLAQPQHIPLIEQAAATNAADVAQVSRLRKLCPDAALVHAALELARARRKAVIKFGSRGQSLFADVPGVEMASSWPAATHKASRFTHLGPVPVLDLCCGIGGDAMALCQAGLGPVLGVDLDPARAWLAGHNTGCQAICADIQKVDVSGHALHIDPARRDAAGRRRWSLRDLQPPPDILRTVLAKTTLGAAIKLGPGVDFAQLADELPPGVTEIISEAGRLTQAVHWLGPLMPRLRESMIGPCTEGDRLATLIASAPHSAAVVHELCGRPNAAALPVESRSSLRYVYEPDDSVERAELLHVLCDHLSMPMLHAQCGLLTSDQLVHSPWLRAFEVIQIRPWNERRVRSLLQSLDVGEVEVKPRGVAVDPSALQQAWQGRGNQALVVLLRRLGSQQQAIIARRV